LAQTVGHFPLFPRCLSAKECAHSADLIWFAGSASAEAIDPNIEIANFSRGFPHAGGMLCECRPGL
jgi:hypothetical protein